MARNMQCLSCPGLPTELGCEQDCGMQEEGRAPRDVPLRPCFLGCLHWSGLEKCPLTAGRRGTPGSRQAGSSWRCSAPASSSPSSSPHRMPRPCRNRRERAGRGGNHSRAAAGLITGQRQGAGSVPWEEAWRRWRVSCRRASTRATRPRPRKPGGTWWRRGAPHGGGPGTARVGDGMHQRMEHHQ